MNNLKISNDLRNRILYQSSSLALYIVLYVLLSVLMKGFYNPVTGAISLVFALLTDVYFSGKRFRIYLRFLIIAAIYFVLYMLLNLFSDLTTGNDTYNIFDKIPFVIFRDSIVSLMFILFYFIFDATHIRKRGRANYWISTLILLAAFLLTLSAMKPDDDILKSVFRNYFFYFLFLILLLGLFVLRHIAFQQDRFKRKLKKYDMLLLMILMLPVIIFLFFFTMQDHINRNNKSNSALFNQSLFQFDFSNFVQLKDEIKMSDDKVLIMELSGVNTETSNRINQGWDKQIYLKRFSLEEYSNGSFRISEKLPDPDSPPVYLSGYMWELPKKPLYKSREDILETLYLINIDASSLMGSDLLTKIIPVTNYEGSSYKQIYKSFCYVLTKNYKDLMSESLSQNRFLKNLPSDRKKILLEWNGGKSEKRIKQLAETVTAQYDDPYYKALSIQLYLWDNYYYSLKPGFAVNGDQLEHFLFDPVESGGRKGYCSYFAFAMTLMLRSIGIPARVAVGFAPDMKNSTLNFYEIRAMDGHAWVEVYFDDYGWVTFDPTSSNFAPGENYQFAIGNKDERDKYIEEILKNKDKMKDVTKKSGNKDLLKDLAHSLNRSIKSAGIILLLILAGAFLVFVCVRKNMNLFLYGFYSDERKKAVFLYRHILGKLFDLGFKVDKNESVGEFAGRMKSAGTADIVGFTEIYQAALFRENREFSATGEDLALIKKNIYTDLKKINGKKRLSAFLNISRAWKKILPLVFVLIVLCNTGLSAQTYNYPSLNVYMEEARKQLDGDFYDKALEILNEAEKKYPDSFEPNLQKGDIYFDHELNENALIEYGKVEKKGYFTEILYENMSTCYSKMGEDVKALKVLEDALILFKDNCSENFYDDLGWQYYKNHRTKDGKEIILQGLKKYPKSSDLYMTLGTLYSDAWDYENSKNCYVNSINYSYEEKSNNFRSIAYYNLALLENSFLFYQEAINSSNASISQSNRSSAHLELNYLYSGAMDLENAYRESKLAASLQPRTLFPEMSIAYIKVNSGKVDEGIKILKDLLENRDFSWMAYFGTSKDSYYSEIYKTLFQAYIYKFNQIKYNDRNDFFSIISRPFKRLYFLGASYYYNFRFTNLEVGTGEVLIKGGSELEGLRRLYDSYERLWPKKAYKLLGIIRKIEKEKNPRDMRILDIKNAALRGKYEFFYSKAMEKKDIVANLEMLDEKWEKEIICNTYQELISITGGEERKKFIGDLFMLHSPFIPMFGLDVDFNIRIDKKGFSDNEARHIIGALSKRGIRNSVKGRFGLEISRNRDFMEVTMTDNGSYLKNYSFVMKGKIDFDRLGMDMFNKMFIYDLNE
jgi:hypothetical protein